MNEKPLPPRLEDIPSEHRLMRIGGHVDEVVVSLQIFGEDLDPSEITNLLGCKPSSARRKGEIIPDKKYHRVAKIGSWHLEGEPFSSLKLEEQVKELLNKVTSELAIWENLISRFNVDIFCGLFFKDFNRGFELSPELMKYLAERGIKIGFDIYVEANYPKELSGLSLEE